LSSCEAEYVAIAAAVQEAKFLRQLWSEMQSCKSDCVLLYVDNQGAISLAKNPVHHKRTKHIDVKYHFIRSEVNKSVMLAYIPTENNTADIFTKPVPRVKMDKLL